MRLRVPMVDAPRSNPQRAIGLATTPDVRRVDDDMNRAAATPKIALLSAFGSEYGYRALNRALTLAEAMERLRLGEPKILVGEESSNWKRVTSTGTATLAVPGQGDGLLDWDTVLDTLDKHPVDAIVLDVFHSPDIQVVTDLIDRKCRVFLIDGFGPASFRADLTFFQASSVPEEISGDPRWSESPFGYEVGPETLILRPIFRRSKLKKPEARQLRVLISMGEKDPTGSTPKILSHVERIDGDFRMTPVLGPLFETNEEFDRVLRGVSRKVDVARAVPDMATLMDHHDLALVSYGTTAFELASRGVPAILVTHDDEQADLARRFGELGTSHYLGPIEELGGEIESETGRILKDRALRLKMSESGRRVVDGRGADRVVLRMRECLDS